MHSYAQPRAFSATALFYVAALLRSAAYRVRGAARRLDAWTADARTATEAIACDACSGEVDETREHDDIRERDETRGLARIAHLNVHVLKDIGAPQWLLTHAAERAANEHLRWIGFDHR
jgi:hypothetical protein